ncbi:glycosyltransferase family 4 protein [Noviherbaspirillum sp. UKPF54]|uniref:glycosyltransferase n=1 Tax=Noviherbaspirillum sp. UKPF54 TaxID=2601898 RepID=UPI0011B104A2|nr:glycosyltransferase family 4 protein [Noviherbaspirillum sp. UKPF54]QDZ27055.1 glycosyltransferase family 4 protein [Noviherbaspirillum sp. UKPF54]
MQRRLKILTWHTHGSYLYYLTQAPHDFYVLSKPDRPPGYGGRCGHIPWGDNVIDLPVDEAKDCQFDCILFQDDDQYLKDQHLYLSEAQRRLPKIYLEHDPPRENPTDMRHPVQDPDVLLVHVTPFNALMWDSGATPARIVEHGVIVPPHVSYGGELERGIVVVNNIARRGRRLGGDVFMRAREAVPLDLVGMGAPEAGGLGEVEHAQLPAFCARYRFFFNPIRYTSLGLAVIEAMMIGMPIVALATTEMATVIDNGVSGYVDTREDVLAERMRKLLAHPGHARELGAAARRYALERFGIERFARDWDAVFRFVTQL